jgi:hypothetical protein
MHDFGPILNWTLKRGSHAFPGPSGGTCINEAAIVAAGHPYRRVRRVEDMPTRFSRPICRLAMRLNDEARDAERQRLMPFVTRLACADDPAVEEARERYIAARMRHGLPFSQGLAVLEGALAIGRRAEASADALAGPHLDTARAEAARRQAARASRPKRNALLALLTGGGWGKVSEDV